MHDMKTRLFVFATITACLVAGCGKRGYRLSGDVTANGAPVADGMIRFEPVDSDSGARSVTATIKEGRYEVSAGQLMAAGSYLVRIEAKRGTGRMTSADESGKEMVEVLEQFIPSKYNTASALTAEVTGSAKDMDFSLEFAE